MNVQSPLDGWVSRFFRWPLLFRIALWMLSAYVSAMPIEWVVGNYNFERCLRLLPIYAALGLGFYAARLLAPFGKTVLKLVIRGAALRKLLSEFKNDIETKIGIKL